MFTNLKIAVEHSNIPFALSLSKGERNVGMLTKWVGESRSCFDKLSTNGFHTIQL
jgi:hypothetical protein